MRPCMPHEPESQNRRGTKHVPNLKRLASAAIAGGCLALAVPAAAGATTTAAPQVAPAVTTGCTFSASYITWPSLGHIAGGGWITCSRVFSVRTVDSSLRRDGVEVAYSRHDCLGTVVGSTTCSVQTQTVVNPAGSQHWCSVSHAFYGGVGGYNATKSECWNG